MYDPTFLQRHWWLYICWIIQFPAMAVFTGMVFFTWSLRQLSTFETHGDLVLSLSIIMVLMWIYQVIFYFLRRLTALCMLCIQVFESVLITYLGWMFWPWLSQMRLNPPKKWHPLIKVVWIGLPVIV
ncbi:hypothetical protein E4T39_06973 [Aureobasidium subglaciale]|nr:hypothetical protein E4T39_06973 [Aureobasidium subglaciale]